MDREKLAKEIWNRSRGLTMENSEEVADYILANFQPKQAETVTAKEVFLELIRGWSSNPNSRNINPSEITKYAFNCAEVFNNYKPE